MFTLMASGQYSRLLYVWPILSKSSTERIFMVYASHFPLIRIDPTRYRLDQPAVVRAYLH